MTTSQLEKYHDFARGLVTEMGKIVKQMQNDFTIVKKKGFFDIATSADIKSEQYCIEQISQAFPDHGINSEESDPISPEADYQWTIDPLDGTKEFSKGLPLFNSSLALEKSGELLVSAVFSPITDTLYSAAQGMGAVKNDQKMHVSQQTDLNKAYVYTYLPRPEKNDPPAHDRAWDTLKDLSKKVYRIRSQSDANITLCWMAQGSYDAYLSLTNPRPWYDLAPGLLIAREAGATITDIDGNEVTRENKSTVVISNGHLHQQLLAILNERKQ